MSGDFPGKLLKAQETKANMDTGECVSQKDLCRVSNGTKCKGTLQNEVEHLPLVYF